MPDQPRGYASVVEGELGSLCQPLAKAAVLRVQAEQDERCLQHTEPFVHRVLVDVGVVADASLVGELTDCPGAQPQDAIDRVQNPECCAVDARRARNWCRDRRLPAFRRRRHIEDRRIATEQQRRIESRDQPAAGQQLRGPRTEQVEEADPSRPRLGNAPRQHEVMEPRSVRTCPA